MINVIIFSKDRACQLDLLLRSLKIFFVEYSLCKISILYKYSNNDFKEGYDRTKLYHPEFNYIVEEDGKFKSQLLSLIDEKLKMTMFFVDDIVFKDYFFIKYKEMQTFLNNGNIACVSLRLCHRIRYCYTERRDTPPPKLSKENTWCWVGLPGDWGYPNSLDSNIYLTDRIIDQMKNMSYSNPNTLEGTWANHPPMDKQLMVCFNESKIFNNPINKVQTVNGNHCGNVSAEEINIQYLLYNRILLEPFIGLKNISAHQEQDLTFFNEIKDNPDAIKNMACHKDMPLE